jgi:hypothetical protein
MKGSMQPAAIAALRSVATILPLTLFLELHGRSRRATTSRCADQWTPALSRPVPTREASAVMTRRSRSRRGGRPSRSLLSSLIQRAVATNFDVHRPRSVTEARALRDVVAASTGQASPQTAYTASA